MSKLKKIVIFLVVLGALIIINIPKEDDRVKMEKEFTIDDFTFAATVLYENKELVNFRPSPENRYECKLEFNMRIKEQIFTMNSKIYSDDQPIKIDNMFLLKDYEDGNLIIYSSYLRFNENGIENNIQIRDLQSFVYLKKENSFFTYTGLYGDFIKTLNEAGYKEYDEEKMGKISKENYDQWIENINKLKEE